MSLKLKSNCSIRRDGFEAAGNIVVSSRGDGSASTVFVALFDIAGAVTLSSCRHEASCGDSLLLSSI